MRAILSVVIIILLVLNNYADDLLLKNGNSIKNVKLIDSTETHYILQIPESQLSINKKYVEYIIYSYYDKTSPVIYYNNLTKKEHVNYIEDMNAFVSDIYLPTVETLEERETDKENRLIEAVNRTTNAIYITWGITMLLGIVGILISL